jgi:transposase-like protein
MARQAQAQPNRGGRGVPYDQETRAAVLAALLSGATVADVSRRLQIPDSTIQYWRDRAGIGPKAPDDAEWIGDEKKADLGELVGEYLNEILVSLRAQAIHTRDKEWLGVQSAGELAILHGVLTDKAIRLLGALRTDDSIRLPDAATP